MSWSTYGKRAKSALKFNASEAKDVHARPIMVEKPKPANWIRNGSLSRTEDALHFLNLDSVTPTNPKAYDRPDTQWFTVPLFVESQEGGREKLDEFENVVKEYLQHHPNEGDNYDVNGFALVKDEWGAKSRNFQVRTDILNGYRLFDIRMTKNDDSYEVGNIIALVVHENIKGYEISLQYRLPEEAKRFNNRDISLFRTMVQNLIEGVR